MAEFQSDLISPVYAPDDFTYEFWAATLISLRRSSNTGIKYKQGGAMTTSTYKVRQHYLAIE